MAVALFLAGFGTENAASGTSPSPAADQTNATSVASPVTPAATSAQLRSLEGDWEGDGAGGKCSITITGDSLYYYGRTNFWFKTSFILPTGTDPQQLHATIKDCARPSEDSIGKVIFAIFKIEDGTLTLVTLTEDDMSDKRPKTFTNASNRYILKQVHPQKKNTDPPKTK